MDELLDYNDARLQKVQEKEEDILTDDDVGLCETKIDELSPYNTLPPKKVLSYCHCCISLLKTNMKEADTIGQGISYMDRHLNEIIKDSYNKQGLDEKRRKKYKGTDFKTDALKLRNIKEDLSGEVQDEPYLKAQ